jgi:hypothetical protein
MSENLKEKIEQNSMPVTETGCWLWTKFVAKDGYGRLNKINGTTLTHRFAWMAYKGKIPENLCVCHKCDTRCCVNPDHLFLGTKKDNAEDMVKKGRHRDHGTTHCKKGHEYSIENTYLYKGGRFCRICHRTQQNKRRRDKRREAREKL